MGGYSYKKRMSFLTMLKAANSGDQTLLENLLASEAPEQKSLDNLCCEAAAAGKVGCVKILIDYGANPNVKESLGKGGQTPLIFACANRDAECAKTLIELGADRNMSGDKGTWTPLHESVSRSD